VGQEHADDERQQEQLSPSRQTRGGPGKSESAGTAGLLALQRQAGNRAVASVLSVQRHAEGKELPDKSELVSSVSSDLAQATDAPVAARSSAPAETTVSPVGSQGESPSGPETVPAAVSVEERRAVIEQGGEYKRQLNAAGPGHGRAMSLAGAQAILQGVYGDVHTIVAGSIQILNGRAALWAKYDEVCIAAHLTNPTTRQPWAAGDSQRRDPGLEGFAWGGVVYVNAETPLVTATAHEMLHNNTAAGFRAAVGEAINEGCTEFLAKRALYDAGVNTPAEATAYPTQVDIVNRLVSFVGVDKVISAYFGGANTFISAYETARNLTGSWGALKTAADSLNVATVASLLVRQPDAGGAGSGGGHGG
jgi:hypothetical protein